MACVKHFCVNNLENARFYTGARCVLREVYLPHFNDCVISTGAASV
jgi:hypothetical protein